MIAKNKQKTFTTGEPIDRSKTYTMSQLCDALGVSRMTVWRYYRQEGLEKFVSQLNQRRWQITGEAYFQWLESRRKSVQST